MLEDLDALEHIGVKGMRWGHKKDTVSSNKSDFKKKAARGAAFTGVLVGTGVTLAVIRKRGQNKAAQKAIQEMLNTPFRWKAAEGAPWQSTLPSQSLKTVSKGMKVFRDGSRIM